MQHPLQILVNLNYIVLKMILWDTQAGKYVHVAGIKFVFFSYDVNVFK